MDGIEAFDHLLHGRHLVHVLDVAPKLMDDFIREHTNKYTAPGSGFFSNKDGVYSDPSDPPIPILSDPPIPTV